MNLRRIRLQLTLLFGAMAAVAVIVLAVVASRWGTERIFDDAEREVENVATEALLDDFWAEEFDADNMWLVNLPDQWTQALGETWVEPPLFRVAEDSFEDSPTFVRFDQEGGWLAHARWVDDETRLVAAIELADFEASASSLKWRLGLAAAGSILFMFIAGYWVAGRSLAPARRAMAQQRDFIADAAHELRTPLSVIQASASHALSRERDPAEYQQSLAEIRDAAVRAGSGVGELLELARLESGQAQPRLAPLRLDLLVEEVGAAARSDEAEINAVPGEPLIVDADYGLVRQAVDNVTANAALRASQVELTSYRDNGWAVVEVSDDGPGFDPAVLPHVFQRFRRGDEKGATGLGMSIVRTIVDAHGGRCEAVNQPEGGAAVRLSFPTVG